MEKKIALVTGGTGGIGTAICQRLAWCDPGFQFKKDVTSAMAICIGCEFNQRI